MPIARKNEVAKHIATLERQLCDLKGVLEGAKPNQNLFNLFAHSESDYFEFFTEIDEDALMYTLGALEMTIKHLKKKSTLKADKLHKSN